MTTPSMYDQITAAQIIKRQRAEQGPPPSPCGGFGAIAYCPSIGAYGWASDQQWRGSAESLAMARCRTAILRGQVRQDGPVTDVAVVASGRTIMLALAVNGRGGHGVGVSLTVRKAERAARRNCPGKGTVVLSLWSTAPEPAQIRSLITHADVPGRGATPWPSTTSSRRAGSRR